MKLYGKTWTRRQLEARIARLEQIGGIRRLHAGDGPEQGVDLIQVRTGAGLSYTVTPTKGMDISLAEWGGTPISWQSAGGDIHPMYYEPAGEGWLRTASGGLLMTCGLMQVGSPSEFAGRHYGLHGRAHHTPARQVCSEGFWQGDEYEMRVRGTVEETALFGGHLRMHREIRSRLGENRLSITDVVENAGFEPCPHMMLYHFNFGFPLLDANTELKFPEGRVQPREKETPLSGFDRWQDPEAGYRERVYYHKPDRSGRVETTINQPHFPIAENQHVPLSVKLAWIADTLPQFVQWKLAGAGSNVLGIEPANCRVEGIGKESERGTLRMLQPGETVRYDLELSVETSRC